MVAPTRARLWGPQWEGCPELAFRGRGRGYTSPATALMPRRRQWPGPQCPAPWAAARCLPAPLPPHAPSRLPALRIALAQTPVGPRVRPTHAAVPPPRTASERLPVGASNPTAGSARPAAGSAHEGRQKPAHSRNAGSTRKPGNPDAADLASEGCPDPGAVATQADRLTFSDSGPQRLRGRELFQWGDPFSVIHSFVHSTVFLEPRSAMHCYKV